MSLRPYVLLVLIVALFCALSACALGQEGSGRLATYFESPEGSAEWKQTEAKLALEVETAGKEYRRKNTMDALQAYDKAVHASLDHGFLLYRVLGTSNAQFPTGFRRSLEGRALELMNIADEYLKLGANDIIAVGIAREVIHKYSVDRMDRAQRRAEDILWQYRYQRNY